MAVAINDDGVSIEIPEAYRQELNEGRDARRRHVKFTNNPYQDQYARTGTIEDLWRAVAWAQGWKGNAR